MKQTICDYCKEVINEEFTDYRGDLDKDNLAIIDITPRALNTSNGNLRNPDLCRKCIIKTLEG